MRILQYYRFNVGTKIRFDEWPGIVEAFLSSQKLSHRYFHYYLESFDFTEHFRAIVDGSGCERCGAPEHYCAKCRKDAENYLRMGTGCRRAEKEHPFLGPVQVYRTDNNTIHALHNYSEASNSSKEAIYAILQKIYRRYGFAETRLIYRDIDFFSRRVFTPKPEYDNPRGHYQGSGIILSRSCLGQDNAIILMVDSTYPGEVPNATPYADAFGKLLPGVKRISGTETIMDDGEKAYYEALHAQAKPLVKQAREFFDSKMPETKGNDDPEEKVSVASWLKKLSKRYGYTYRGYIYYMYFVEKKLANGHYICLEFVSNPSCPDADPFVSLCGLGFHHKIWGDVFGPQNARDAGEYFTLLFDTLAEAERTVFPSILDLYPPSPDWFLPDH